MYYYGARYYDPRISIMISVDQMVESTMTPYQYVSNNPIMRIDPTGMNDHDYKKSKETGRLTVVPGSEDNPAYDRIIDSDGNIIKVDKGVINKDNQQVKLTGFDVTHGNSKRTITYDYYEFSDKDKAYEFYDFMRDDKTNWVEFSLNEYTSSNGNNFFHIGTIGEQTQEGSWNILFDNEYKKDNGINSNIARHHHPYEPTPSPADRDAKDYFLNKYPNQKTNFLIDCYECEFNKETNKVVPKSVITY